MKRPAYDEWLRLRAALRRAEGEAREEDGPEIPERRSPRVPSKARPNTERVGRFVATASGRVRARPLEPTPRSQYFDPEYRGHASMLWIALIVIGMLGLAGINGAIHDHPRPTAEAILPLTMMIMLCLGSILLGAMALATNHFGTGRD